MHVIASFSFLIFMNQILRYILIIFTLNIIIHNNYVLPICYYNNILCNYIMLLDNYYHYCLVR